MTRTDPIILVINPGSTSTKLALYAAEKELQSVTIKHSAAELAPFATINEQLPLRKKAVMDFLRKSGTALTDLAAIATRGGVIGRLESGAYLIDSALAEASYNSIAPHPANLAPIIGYQLAEETGGRINAYIYDAVCGCGNPDKLFLYSGVPELEPILWCIWAAALPPTCCRAAKLLIWWPMMRVPSLQSVQAECPAAGW